MKNTKLSIVTVTHNRPQQLISSAAFSLQQQTNLSFEWIVINDGGDKETSDSIAQLQPDFDAAHGGRGSLAETEAAIIYADLEHPQTGFGLCYGRNLGLKLASGELVTYLDDDNQLRKNFVDRTLSFFQSHPKIKFSMPLQQRRRDVIEGSKIIKSGKPFLSPLSTTTVVDLIEQKQLFDSNGFTHYRIDSPQWNQDYRIYCDYEYFLKCFNSWSEDTFALNPQVLVDYVQTNDGVIGQSSYSDWAVELERIIENFHNYSILKSNPEYIETLQQLQQKFKNKQETNSVPEAFKTN
jgi:glycosyltransferase involved in cell wall biosynthesis